jgi:hypothetical protein
LRQTRVIPAGILALDDGFDVAQASAVGNLRKQQGQQQLPGAQPAHPFIRTVLLDQPVERAERKLLYKLAEDSILMRHGAGPSHVRVVGKRFGPIRINAMHFAHPKRTGQPWIKSGDDDVWKVAIRSISVRLGI